LLTVSIVAPTKDRNQTEILLQYVQNNQLGSNLAAVSKGTALPKPPGAKQSNDQMQTESNKPESKVEAATDRNSPPIP
jgi:hypothetical protein